VEKFACGEKEACILMGCTADRLAKLRRAGKLKEIGRGWYAIEDLKACIETLRTERDKADNVVYIESAPKKARAVGSEGGRPGYRTAEELLR
jgi:hypothetical protein